MAKLESAVPEIIRGSTRFYPYFKDCIGAIDGTHIPAKVCGHDNNSYQFTGQGRHPEDAKELFNLRHASLRNVIERTFGIFKSRFKIFKMAPPFPYTTQTELVLACAGLHNFLQNKCRCDEFQVEPDNEAQLSSSAQVYEDDNFDQLFDTQEQQRAKANVWRDTIANGM
ncbi:uncharacterized protein [Primulina eburnea]|uniref:uncharacterized protein n=1 Tax=Primulina eburnea TaxID=1245227 RepID=UPI003C6C012A